MGDLKGKRLLNCFFCTFFMLFLYLFHVSDCDTIGLIMDQEIGNGITDTKRIIQDGDRT